MTPIRTLVDRDQDKLKPVLPHGLRVLYDGDLHFQTSPAERPFVFANFVSTLDGVVSCAVKGQGSGSAISGSDPADRFIMGLLRASADAIMVGARTVHDTGPQSLWTPESIYPDAKHLYAEYRADVLHKPQRPLLVVVSGSGKLELGRAIFRMPEARTVVMTTPAGRDALTTAGAAKLPSVQIHALDSSSGALDPLTMLQLLYAQYGIRSLLHEGGPSLFGEFMAAQAVDELFLTLSPQIAGRTSDAMRPALVQGTAFMPESAPWFQLLNVKQSADHLYLRYQRTGSLSKPVSAG
jgi:riboflavin biosynthesis pyrimidine reductase